jgi:hypothetical protein
MRVVFDAESAQYHPGVGLDLQPGENEVSAEQGAELLAAGLVRVVEPVEEKPARRRSAAPEPAPVASKED